MGVGKGKVGCVCPRAPPVTLHVVNASYSSNGEPTELYPNIVINVL